MNQTPNIIKLPGENRRNSSRHQYKQVFLKQIPEVQETSKQKYRPTEFIKLCCAQQRMQSAEIRVNPCNEKKCVNYSIA